MNTRLFQLTDIKHCVSSAYHPQNNGLDERFNQTLMNTLKKVVDASKDEWDEHLAAALYAYRISTQASSKYTPFFLMYNRHPRKAITFEVEQKADEVKSEVEEEKTDTEEMSEQEDGDQDIDELLRRAIELRDKCHDKVKENIAAAQQKQKRQYDEKHNSLKVRWHYFNLEFLKFPVQYYINIRQVAALALLLATIGGSDMSLEYIYVIYV